ncbi:hypothetical protein KOR42_30800 [Thalassoglobus neptunius]|uniref:Chromosome partition protein Smc n=1 Tax=Thalassoglobus neptunius TaxID=1938619 RepID=A0A5C5WQY4_9PLAN|nr:hypothetical protein [Thalassoglobus neptunius]TWT52212.1 hypothetical protein KOR42_30800 [Thalassoglobus neptunius]
MQFFTHMKWLVAAILIVSQWSVCASLATAQEDREFREQMQDLSRRYMELRREGQSPEAEEFRQRMIDLARERNETQRRQLTERREINERIANLQRELTKLRETGENIRAEEVEEQIERHREELLSLNRPQAPPKERSLEERIRHIHEAAEHLEQAGMSHFSRMLQEEAKILANNHRELHHVHERERAMREEAEHQKNLAEQHRHRAEQELRNAQRQLEELTRQLNDSRRRPQDERRGETPSRSERSSRDFGEAWNNALRELAPQESQQRPDSERLRRLYEERTRIERERSEQIRRQSSGSPVESENVERSRNEPRSSSRDAEREINRDRESPDNLTELQSLVNSLRTELFQLKMKVQNLERRHPELKPSPRPSRSENLEPTPAPDSNDEAASEEEAEDAAVDSTGNIIQTGNEQEVSVFAGSNSYQLSIPNQGIRFAQSPEAETTVW